MEDVLLRHRGNALAASDALGMPKKTFSINCVDSALPPKTSVDMDARRRQRPRLALAIVATLVVKVVALAMIWSIWFSHSQGKRLDGEQVGSAIVASPSAPPEKGSAHDRP